MIDSIQQQFGSQLLTVPQIFKNHFFIIPDYQRSYSWDEKQVFEMLKDLEHLIKDDVQIRHYTGTLVLSQPANCNSGEYHIVDGQQRLTTLVILLSSLRKKLPKTEQENFRATYLTRGEQGNERSVLQLNSDTKMYFERVVLEENDLVDEPKLLEAHERIDASKKIITNWLNEQINNGISVESIKQAVETELGFLVYAPKEDAETGIMFEVINNRGKQLSELEKVKNYLIYCCVKLRLKTLRDKINSDWSDIIKNLNTAQKTSPADESSFLRYCVAVFFKLNKSSSQYGYDEIKKLLLIDEALKSPQLHEETSKNIENFVYFMKLSALWYARLYGRQHADLDRAIVPLLDQIRAQGQHASIMPLFLALVIKKQGTGNRLMDLLSLLEILNFRVYMTLKIAGRNDSGQGRLYTLAARYYHDDLFSDLNNVEKDVLHKKLNDIDDVLEFKLTKFIFRMAPDTLFTESFILKQDSPDDFYKWNGLRYFLMNYEAFLQPKKTILIDQITLSRSESKSGDYLSVEHIWATENRNGEGENNRKIDLHEKRRLGNFCLLELRLNIKGGKYCLAEKIPKYIKVIKNEPTTDLHQVRLMAKTAVSLIRKYRNTAQTKNYFLNIHHELNNKQEKAYINFAEERWSIKNQIGYDFLVESDTYDSDDED